MEISAAYDLTGSYRKAAELAGCDHHTVRRYVQVRGTGQDPAAPASRAKMIDTFMPKVEELVEKSFGKIGTDQVHKKLVATGSRAPTAPHAARWPPPESPGGPATAGSTARG